MKTKIIDWFKSITIKEWILYTVLFILIVTSVIFFVFMFGDFGKEPYPDFVYTKTLKTNESDSEDFKIEYTEYLQGEFKDENIYSIHYAINYIEHGVYFDSIDNNGENQAIEVGDTLDVKDNINKKRVTHAAAIYDEDSYKINFSFIIDYNDNHTYDQGDYHLSISYFYKTNEASEIPQGSEGEWTTPEWIKK